MWKAFEIEATGRNVKFGIREDGAPMSSRNFMELLSESQAFRKFYNRLLADSGFDAFFWENKPIADQTLDNEYECNIINSVFLAGRTPDAQIFSRYFDKAENVVTFPNLGADAELIVPCPKKENVCYTHIGSFVRRADADQTDDFWKITGQKTLRAIGRKPKWLSTSGLGVSWLHVRIDSYPKYYQTKEYKSV